MENSETQRSKTARKFSWKTLLFGAFLGTTIGVVAIFAVLLTAYNLYQKESVSKMAEIKELKPLLLRADFDWTVTGLDGNPVELKGLKGQTTFLHFWRPSCVSCVAEVPSLNALYDTFAPKGLNFVTIALNAEEDLAVDVAEHGIRFPVYSAAQKDIPAVFAPTATPTTFIVDENGFVALKHAGAVDWAVGDTAAFMEEVLAR